MEVATEVVRVLDQALAAETVVPRAFKGLFGMRVDSEFRFEVARLMRDLGLPGPTSSYDALVMCFWAHLRKSWFKDLNFGRPKETFVNALV